MAITFSKSISTTKLLNAYNNNVVEFTSDSILDATKCTITIGGKSFEITPNSSNVFRFNFREIVKVLMSNNFEDTITPTTNLEIDNSLNNSYNVVYTITLSDTSTETTNQTYVFVKSVEQIANVSNRLLTGQSLLSNNVLTFFKGFPFDIGHYSNGNVTVTNTTTTLNKILTSIATNTDRIFLSLGDSIIQDTGVDILNVGYNNVTINVDALTVKLNDVTCGGTYLKWFNNKGGYSYWLFNPIHKEKVTVKTLDSFNVDFESIDNTYTTELIMGKTAVTTRDLLAESLTDNEMLQIKDLFVSPRIEMYNGVYGGAFSTWQTVKVKSGTVQTQNTKKDFHNIKLTIEINQYTQV